MGFIVKHEFPSNKDFNDVFLSVGWGSREDERIEKTRENTVFAVSVYENENIVGMARVIGDGAYFMVYDLCVRKEYQGKGVGRILVTEIVNWYKDIEDEDTVLHLGSAEGKEKFYEKFGFVARPYSGVGASMKYDPEFQK